MVLLLQQAAECFRVGVEGVGRKRQVDIRRDYYGFRRMNPPKIVEFEKAKKMGEPKRQEQWLATAWEDAKESLDPNKRRNAEKLNLLNRIACDQPKEIGEGNLFNNLSARIEYIYAVDLKMRQK